MITTNYWDEYKSSSEVSQNDIESYCLIDWLCRIVGPISIRFVVISYVFHWP